MLGQRAAIYGLYDPRKPGLIMYVGKGSPKRAQHHWKIFIKQDKAVNWKLGRWFTVLRLEAVEPQWRFLKENVPPQRWQYWERHYIKKWRKLNPHLCNVSAGGNAWPKEAGQIGGYSNVLNKTGFCKPGVQSLAGRKGGCVQGRNNVLNKTGFCKPGAAEKGRRKSQKLKIGIFAPGVSSRGGRVGGPVGGHTQGCRNAANGHLTRISREYWKKISTIRRRK